MTRIRVWDLPTRLFHWLLAVCVFGAFISAQIGGNAMVWHGRFGLTVTGSLSFIYQANGAEALIIKFPKRLQSVSTLVRHIVSLALQNDMSTNK